MGEVGQFPNVFRGGRADVVGEEVAAIGGVVAQDRFRESPAADTFEHLAPAEDRRIDSGEAAGMLQDDIDEAIRRSVDLTLGEGPEIDKPDAARQRLGKARFGEEPCGAGQRELSSFLGGVEGQLDGEDQRIAAPLHFVDEQRPIEAGDKACGVGSGQAEVGRLVKTEIGAPALPCRRPSRAVFPDWRGPFRTMARAALRRRSAKASARRAMRGSGGTSDTSPSV